MKLVFTDQALISINQSFDFLHLQGIAPEKITLIFEKLFERTERLLETPLIGQIEFPMPGSDK